MQGTLPKFFDVMDQIFIITGTTSQDYIATLISREGYKN